MQRRKNKTNNALNTANKAAIAKAGAATSALTAHSAQTQLEAEFCPPLDGALVAALLSEYDATTLTPNSFETIRLTLKELAAVAEPIEAITDLSLEESVKSDVFTSIDGGSETLSTSPSSDISFSSPIGFLQTIFPHIPVHRLENALADARKVPDGTTLSAEDFEPDMDSIVDTILSEECVREITERGYLDSDDEEGSKIVRELGLDEPWADVKTPKGKENGKKKGPQGGVIPNGMGASPSRGGNLDTNGLGPRKGKRIKAVALVDIRQRGQGPPRLPSSSSINSGVVIPDPWAHVASLAEALSVLVPQTGYNEWLGLFHKPLYRSPVGAVRAHLKNLASRAKGVVSEVDIITLVELLPEEDEDDLLRRGWTDTSLADDARLVLTAVWQNPSRMADALDLMLLLRDLDASDAVILHAKPSTSTRRLSSSHTSLPILQTAVSNVAYSASAPSSPRKIDASLLTPKKPASTHHHIKGLGGGWTTVTHKKQIEEPEWEGLAAFIPAYRDVKRGKMKAPGVYHEDEDVDDPVRCRETSAGYRAKRDAALRKASSHWQQRGRIGAEVALHYAEEARMYESQSRKWAVRGARAQVKRSLQAQDDGRTIDLHGLTVHEAHVVARESVNEWWNSKGAGSKPVGSFTIITGVGKHSAGSGVLAPSVHKMLQLEGWTVRKEYGKLVVSSLAR